MLQKLINHLQSYKTIGVFGYGKEGQSTHQFLNKYLSYTKVIIIDQQNGENYLDDLENCDLIIKSPGISLFKLGIEYTRYNFTSATELFIKYFKQNIIGITGTKGKSTLASLLYQVLQNAKKKTLLCGNIGVPVFEIIEEVENDTIVVMELSSHQLDNIQYSPHISVLTNIYQDHLDYYKSLASYIEAKLNIFKYQSSDDIAYMAQKDNRLDDVLKSQKSICIEDKCRSVEIQSKSFIHKDTICFVYMIAKSLAVDENEIIETITNFTSLPHRIEYVNTIDGKEFYNDSISTIPEAAINAVETFKDVEVLILGGFNRGIDYSKLIGFLHTKDIPTLILISQVGKLIEGLLHKSGYRGEMLYFQDLKEAMNYIDTKTQKGIYLFSPAASSFDQYKNFEERGEDFKKLINK